LSRTPRAWDRGFGGFGVSKYLVHNGRGIPSNEAIGRHIFQNHRTGGNNRTPPIVTPGRIRLPIASQLHVRMRIGATLSLKSSRRTSWLPVQRNDLRAMQTFDSIVTCARLRTPTSSPIQTWSPTTRRQGKEIFTLLPMPTPFPIFAPNKRSKAERKADPQGQGF